MVEATASLTVGNVFKVKVLLSSIYIVPEKVADEVKTQQAPLLPPLVELASGLAVWEEASHPPSLM